MKIIKAQTIAQKRNLEEQIKIETKLSREYNKMFNNTSNYTYFEKLINSETRIFHAKEQLLLKTVLKNMKKKFLKIGIPFLKKPWKPMVKAVKNSSS